MSRQSNVLGVVLLLMAGPLTANDVMHIERLDPDERIALVLDVLRWREGELDNCSYRLSEIAENVRIGEPGDRQLSMTNEIVVKRRDHSFMMQYRRTAGPSPIRTTTWWDGDVQTTISHRNGGVPVQATVQGEEFDLFRRIYYHHMLGIRTPESTLSLSEWMVFQIDTLTSEITVEVDKTGDAPLIAVQIQPAAKYWHRFWIDPNRDHMPVRYQYQINYGDATGGATAEVVNAKQVDGLWVPMVVLRRNSVDWDAGYGEFQYRVSSFSRGRTSEEDVRPELAPGTIVVDTVRGMAYRILPGDGVEPMPYYDPATGEIRTAAIEEVREAMQPMEVLETEK